MGTRALAVFVGFIILMTGAVEARAAAVDVAPASPGGPSPEALPAYFDHYSSFAEMTLFLQGLAANHSAVSYLTSIGTTIEGRPIWGLRISNEPTVNNLSKPTVIIEANHHAREWMTPEAVVYIAHYMLENYRTDPYIWNIINTTQVWLVPKVNVDGFIYDGNGDYPNGQMWRKNRRDNGDGTYGVDLNRNYDWSWDKGDPNTASTVYHGTAPFSEPETQALRDLALASNVSVYLAYHSYSELILYPWGDTYEPTPDDILLRTLAYEMQARIPNVAGGGRQYTVTQSIYLYPAYGVSEDWFYGATGAMSFTLELYPAGSGGGGFYPPPSKIADVVQDNLWAALYLMDVAGNPADTLMDMEVTPGSQVVDAGRTATYDVTLHNNAYDAATFNLAATGVPLTWSKTLPSTVEVPARSQQTVQLNVTAPWDDLGGTANITVSAEIQGYATASRTAIVSLTVNPIVREVGVDVAAPPGQTALPGSTVHYNFTVVNTGNVEDTFSLAAASSGGWTVTAPASVTVAAGFQKAVQVSVEVPAGAPGGGTDAITLTASSVYDPAYSDLDSTTTTVETVRSVGLTAAANQLAMPGEVVTLSFTAANDGNVLESLIVSPSDSEGWSISVPPSVDVPAASSVSLDVQVGVPANALLGTADQVTVQVESSADPSATAVASAKVTVLRRSDVTVSAPSGSSGEPGDVLAYDFEVTNLGNGVELFLLEAFIDPGWSVVGPSEVRVDPSATAVVTYEVTIPANASAASTGLLTVSARSLYDSSAKDTATVGTGVVQVYGVAVTAGATSVTADPAASGYEVSLAYTVENRGNGPDSFVPSWDLPDGWAGTVDEPSVALDRGGSAEVRLTVAVGGSTQAGDYRVALSAISMGGPEDTAVTTVTVMRPDLVLVGIEVDRTSVSAGDVVTVTAEVQNLGDGASPPADIALYVGDEVAPRSVETTGTLAPGAKGHAAFEVSLDSPGEVVLTVKVDPENTVVETDDAAEEGNVSVTVMALSRGLNPVLILPWLVLLIVVPLLMLALWRRRKGD
jgi:uncharacterized membrane protein